MKKIFDDLARHRGADDRVYYFDFEHQLRDFDHVDGFDILMINDEIHYAILNDIQSLFYFSLGLGHVDKEHV